MKLYLKLAKKIEGKSGIALTSVSLSIAIILIATSVADGFKKEIGESASGFSGDLMLTAPGQDITTYLYPVDMNLDCIDKISALPCVNSVGAVAYCPGMLKTDENVHGALFKGVDSTYSLSFFSKFLSEGELPSFNTPDRPSNDVLISRRLADMLGYSCGDKVTVYFIDENVRARRFRITGIYDVRLEDVDEKLILCDLRHVQMLNGWDIDEVSCVEMTLQKDISMPVTRREREKIAEEMQGTVSACANDEDEMVTVRTVEDVYPHLFDWLGLLDMNVLIVLILMMAVAGFNMISGLLIILFQNISSIGLFKALGMKTSGVCKVFLWKSAGIILKGMILGNGIAVMLLKLQEHFHLMKLSPENYFTDHVPVCMDPSKILLLNAVSFLIMMLIMAVPSGFISRISPASTVKAE